MTAAENVKATFFVLGENVLNFPDIIKRQRKEGHEVANHSWSHLNLGCASATAIRSQLAMTNAVLAQLMRERSTTFRGSSENFGQADAAGL